MTTVDIGRTVNYETLERALTNAAEQLGWKADIRDEFRRGYKLGSVHETKDYSGTRIYLSGVIFPALRIVGLRKERLASSFEVWDGLPFGIASKSKVEQYLSAVSEALS